MFGMVSAGFIPFIVIGLFILWNSINILPEYERGVVFRLGRVVAARGPGLILVIPGLERMVRVDLRTLTYDVPVQEVITKDNVPCKVNAVAYFKVLDPVKAVVEVMNYTMATSQIAQTTLRSVLGQVDFDELLSHREKINSQLQQIIDQQTDPWGIKVSIVEIKDVQVPEQMQRAMAHQAEAERDRRAKIIAAEGEFQASQKLADAAKVIATEPAALALRFLQTAAEIGASDRASTLILPIPLELLKFMATMAEKGRN
jgi:regulator of protease activity HflC (stomatin/prohibitin superfamily)